MWPGYDAALERFWMARNQHINDRENTTAKEASSYSPRDSADVLDVRVILVPELVYRLLDVERS